MGFFDNLAASISKMSLEGISDHIRLENVENDRTLIMKDGTLVSMIKLGGMFQVAGPAAIIDAARRMRLGLAPYLSRPGHAISINFLRDPEAGSTEVSRLIRATQRSAMKTGLDVDDVLQEREKVLGERLVMEQTIICMFSRPSLLDKEENKLGREMLRKKNKNKLIIRDAQDLNRTMETLLIRHDAFVSVMLKMFKDTGQMADQLTAEEMMREARAGLNPDVLSSNDGWKPNFPFWSDVQQIDGNPKGSTVSMMPETRDAMSGIDFSAFHPVTLDRQLALEDASIEDSQCVRIGANYFTSFDMSVPPEVLIDFNTLVARMNTGMRKVPWRCSFLIESGGVQALAMKERYLDFFTILAKMHNRRIADSIRELREIDGEADNVVRFRATFTTWSKSREELRVYAQTLSNAVKSWGNAMVDGMSGDIMATTVSTIPGATLASTAPTGGGPLTDVLCLSPIGRAASAWSNGSVMFRTGSGKPWPYQPGSSQQETWINLFCGTPGSGKSVLLNAINLGSIMSGSLSSSGTVLPRVSILDIGMSSFGLISLIKEALPKEMKHLATSRRLSMSTKDAVNVFDTPLGCRMPTPLAKSFLANFMSIICSSGTTKVSGSMIGLINAAIDEVYKRFSDNNSPKPYYVGEEPAVDAALREIHHKPEIDEKWWEVVDILASKGRLYEAEIAQRRAVPLLSDLATIASQNDTIRSLYGDDTREITGELTIDAFIRMVSEITLAFPILTSHTRLDFGSARIIALDLMDVAPPGEEDMAAKTTALMYMVGRDITTRDFYQKGDDFVGLVNSGGMPKQYMKYHIRRCKENLQIQKVICFDEFHRAKSSPAVINQLERDGREGRKFNVSVNVISQLPEDFSKDMFDIASGIFVCNARGSSRNFLKEMLNLSEADLYTMEYNLNGPSREGAPFWAMFMIKNRGQIRQELNLTLGPVELWAFSTTAKDIAVRTALYESVGPKRARAVLAKMYPGGSVQQEIDARVARIEADADRLGDSAEVNVIENIVDELTKQALMA